MGVNHCSSPIFWRLIFRSLYLRMPRVSVVFSALAMGATIVTAMSALYFDINAKMSRELRTFGANFYIGPGDGDLLAQETFQSIIDRAPQGLIHAASPVHYGQIPSGLEKVMVMGVGFESLQQLMPYWQVRGRWIGVNFDNRNGMMGVRLAERLHINVGDSITLFSDGKQQKLQIKGIVDAGDATDNMLIVSLDLVQQWLNHIGYISHALLSVSNDLGQIDTFSLHLQQQYPDLEFRPVRKISASEGKILNKINVLIGILTIIILILSSLCVNTTLMAMVGERRYEFALQKALGAGKRDIICQILTETIIIAITAVLGGILLGYLLAQILGQAVFDAKIALSAPVVPLTLFLLLMVAAIATIIPAWRAIHIKPAHILKGE